LISVSELFFNCWLLKRWKRELVMFVKLIRVVHGIGFVGTV